MNETLDSKKNREDLGIRFRRCIQRVIKACLLTCKRDKRSKSREGINSPASEVAEFISDEEEFSRGHSRRRSEEPLLMSPGKPTQRHLPSYRYRRQSSSYSALLRPTTADASQLPHPRFTDILTKQVIINMIVYSGLALHTISFDQLFPLLCSTKIEDGGLGMTAGQIGVALSMAGVMAMVLQITLFPWGHNKFGGLFCLRFVLGLYTINYFVTFPLYHN